MQDTGCRNRVAGFILNPVSCILYLVLILMMPAYSSDVSVAVSGLQKRYASVETVKGNFQQIYRAPGILQEQSGEFWLKRPGLMRWEYRNPEEQLFVADGRESYLYVPRDRQVTIQPLSSADLHNTPLNFLLGSGEINKSFFVTLENEFKPRAEGTRMIRLVPRAQRSDFSFLVLELDQKSFELRRIAVREPGGSTTEFFLTNVVTNTKFDKQLFQFKTPKGVEEIRLNNEQ